jgi:glucose/arabinose dehydrogenase
MRNPKYFIALLALACRLSSAAQPATVVAWGGLETPYAITNAIAISTKGGGGLGPHALALLADGTVAGWGNNTDGQATPPADLTNAISVAAGSMHSVAARSDGTVVCWGRNYLGEASPPEGLSNVVAVAAAYIYSLALLADGTVVGWGPDLLVPEGLSNIVAIAAGVDHVLALKRNGTVVGWGGPNQFGQATVSDNLTNVSAIAAGRMCSLALQSNGTVVAWGNLGVGPPNNLSNVLGFAEGGMHGMAILSDHHLQVWGFNFNGALNYPKQHTNFTAVAAGDDISIGLTLQPVIFTQPSGFTADAGNNGTLMVEAFGSTRLSYQWRQNGNDLIGSTNATLTLPNLQAPNAGNYYALISNAGGSVTSAVAVINVNPSAPVILTNLTAKSVLAGSKVTFQLGVIGSAPLAFQWRYNGVPIPNETNAVLVLTNLTDFDEGSYQAVISNPFGTNSSATVSLTVNYPPRVTNVLSSLNVPAGTNYILRAFADGNQPLSYQWQWQGATILGSTNMSLVLTNIQSPNAGEYGIVVSNAFGVVTNLVYALTVVDSPPVIFAQPVSQAFLTGQTVVLRALAYGSAPLSSQWWHGGSAIAGATDTSLILTNLQSADAGTYFVSLSNRFGFTNSAPATLSLGDPYPEQVDWPSFSFTQLGTNRFSAPSGITHAGDGSGRLFVVERKGQIWVVQGSNVLAQPFLSISNLVLSTGAEQGLLGIAFSPGFFTNHHFYLDYTRKPDGATVISRFSTTTTNANVADTNSEQVLKVINQPFPNHNHNGGQLAFGPDGYLYIGMGDGGYSSTGDPLTNAQNTASLLGKLLRIDVDSGVLPYAVPSNNPFVNNASAAPEIWALGLCNPWHFSFDRATGDLYIGDGGFTSYEEMNFQSANSPGGQNYGWRIREGPVPYIQPPGFDLSTLTEPVTSYGHSLGGSVTAGFVYRGPNEPRMNGRYFFGDFTSGRIWGLKRVGTTWQRYEVVDTTYIIRTFGEDEQGRLLLASYTDGRIYQIQDTRQVLKPTFSPASGIINFETVTVACATPGVLIHYTSDGRDPTEFDPGVLSGGTIAVRGGTTTKLRAFRGDLTPSAVASAVFNQKVALPIFAPRQGPITNGTSVSVTTVTPDATIRYTVDGAVPTTNSTPYTGPIILNGNMTLTARAFRPGFVDSDIQQQYFVLVTVATPVFSPASGPITNGTRITISSTTAGAVLYYTLDGSVPTTHSSVYTGPFPINGNVALTAVGVASGYLDSAIQTAFYSLVQVMAPVFDPSSSPLTNGARISISCATPTALIYYTVDGSLPTTNSPVFTDPLVFSGPITLNARAFADQFDPSDLGSAFFGLIDSKDTVVTTWAGTSVSGFTNGMGTLARFSSPQGICIDHKGNLYVADTGNNVIRKILATGEVTTFAGTGVAGSQLGSATTAQFFGPTGVCLDSTGNVYVADSGNCNRICRIDTNGIVTTFANVTVCGPGIGNAAPALGQMETGLDGNFYVGSWFSLVKILPDGTVTILAGSGCNCPGGWGMNVGVGVDAASNTYSATGAYLWKTAPDASTELFAGGIGAFSDGPRLLAGFYNLQDAFVDSFTNMFLGDTTRIRKISEGWISTLAGTGVSGYKNGRGSAAQFYNAAGLCVDTNGNIYVADPGNHCIRKVAPDTAGIGISDDWQRTQFGTVGIDPNGDPDHDGMSNFAEFWGGTNPHDDTSFLTIESLTILADGQAKITWRSARGVSYLVKYSDNFITWSVLGQRIQGDGSVLSLLDPTPAGQVQRRLYRVFLADL